LGAVEAGLAFRRDAVETAPLDDNAFAALMASLEPFERRPRLAVAVSGGADSMALALLAARWAAARGGTILALTVDHGLRPESAAEAARVGAWLNARGIAHAILPWTGPKPDTRIQEAARAARYALLLDRCREQGILHLLVAHHQGDQAETVAQRRAQSSGMAGLAGMAPVVPTPGARLLRPLLAVPKARLEATLLAQGQGWIEDPSNRNTVFLRVRNRARLAAEDGAAAMAGIAAAAAGERAVLDAEAARVLAASATVSPAGFMRIDVEVFAAAPERVGLHALAAVLRTVGGSVYPPRGDRLERLAAEIQAGLKKRRTLAGCLVSPSPRGLLVQREPAAVTETIPVEGGGTVHWDGRFRLRLEGTGKAFIAGLGPNCGRLRQDSAGEGWPGSVLPTLPAVFDAQGIAAVPYFDWCRKGFSGPIIVDWSFAPSSPLSGGLVWHRAGTMC
jgi:tRNA(Ile)-lysidine synthase